MRMEKEQMGSGQLALWLKKQGKKQTNGAEEMASVLKASLHNAAQTMQPCAAATACAVTLASFGVPAAAAHGLPNRPHGSRATAH